MLTGAAWALAVILAGLLVVVVGLAMHAWEMAGSALLRVERLERTVRLLSRRRALEEAEETVKASAWWAAS